jgi:hypothetical protein
MCWASNHQNIIEMAQGHISLSTSHLTCLKVNQMHYISCAYDQFEHLLARAFIAKHIAQHHIEHLYTLTAILFKLLHSPFDPCILSGGVAFFLFPCLALAERTC